MTSAIIAMASVMAILTGAIHMLAVLKRRFLDNPEIIRKLLHLSMGTLALSFPWVFDSVWPVVTLSIIASLFISLVKVSNLLEWRPVLCASGRRSIGEICFPLSIGLLFLLSGGDKLTYLIPVAILTYADSASALIGQRFGAHAFETNGGAKSAEGSLAFLLTSFTCAFASLHLLIPGAGLAQSLLLAFILALLAMMLEAVSWNGLDNFLIPVGTYYALTTHLPLAIDELVVRAFILSVLAAFMIGGRRRTTLDGGAILGAVLFAYFSWVMGGLIWMVIPVSLFISYRFLLPQRYRESRGIHSVYGVVSVVSAGVMWLLVANQKAAPEYIFPYALAFAAHAAIISIAHLRSHKLDKPRTYALLFAVLKAWCLICLPLVFLQPTLQMVLLSFFLAPFCIAIPTFLFFRGNQRSLAHDARLERRRWLRQALYGAIASALGLIPLLMR